MELSVMTSCLGAATKATGADCCDGRKKEAHG